MREFELFEARIKNEAPLQRVTAVQCGQASKMVRAGFFQPVKGPVDYVLGIDGRVVILDAKATNERIWNLKKYLLHPSKIHQWAQLMNAHSNGNLSGYLIWFVVFEKIVWASTGSLIRIMEGGGLSVHPDSPGFTSQDAGSPIDFRRLILG